MYTLQGDIFHIKVAEFLTQFIDRQTDTHDGTPITDNVYIAFWGYVTTIESFGINYLQGYRYPAVPLVCEIKLEGTENREDTHDNSRAPRRVARVLDYCATTRGSRSVPGRKFRGFFLFSTFSGFCSVFPERTSHRARRLKFSGNSRRESICDQVT